MKRLFISDVHVGKADSKYADLAMLLHNEQFDEIYIIGDLVDLWVDSLKDIKKRNALFFSVFQSLKDKGVKIHYVLGNHDLNLDVNDVFFKDLSINLTYTIELENKKVRLIHGHQYDFLIMDFFPLSKIAAFLYNLILKIFKKEVNSLKVSLAAKQAEKAYHSLVDEIEKHALADNKDCNVLLMGHTHAPKQIVTNGILYLNCGDWVSHKSYVIEENSQFTLYNI